MAFPRVGIAAEVEGLGKIWLQLDGLVEIADGAVPLGFPVVGVAAARDYGCEILVVKLSRLQKPRAKANPDIRIQRLAKTFLFVVLNIRSICRADVQNRDGDCYQ